MKRLIISTIVLVAATIAVTVLYFKNVNTPGLQTAKVFQTIPNDAVFVFGMNNDKEFYDIFAGSKLLTSLTGDGRMADLDTLRNKLLRDTAFSQFVDDQDVFLAIHPQKDAETGWAITLSTNNNFNPSTFKNLLNKPYKGMVINTVNISGKPGYTVYFNSLKKRFFILDKGHHIYAGSFSEPLINEYARHDDNQTSTFVQLSDKQNANTLANIYINYNQLQPLFDQLFSNKFADVFKSFRLLSATGALTLNYKSDALMFNGYTYVHNNPVSYLNLFLDQQPVANELKDIFPSTTAYSTSFGVSDPQKFLSELSDFHVKAGLDGDKKKLFSKIKSETGIDLKKEFKPLLGNEFAIITTRFQEKIAIIQLKNGSQARPVLVNISSMATDDIGQFRFERVPFFLLGDAFNVLKRPYFRIFDNYLVLASSMAEINSYADSYFNHKMLSKMQEYNNFDDLVSERSNVSFYINFKNVAPVFKRDMEPSFYKGFDSWKNFYAASYQLTASGKKYYTNLCMKLNPADTAASAKN